MGLKWSLPVRGATRVGLQLSGCAVLAWAWLQATPDPTSTQPPPQLIPKIRTQAAAPPQPAAQPAAAQASILPIDLGASTIEVIVSRNDTLDRIFRRLKLDLSDLASVRNLPGLKNALDDLRPGEALHLVHR